MEETRLSPSPLRHSDRYKPRCTYCGRKFNTYGDLHTHTLEEHHIRLTAEHICWRCNLVCKNEAGLWRHMACAHYKISRKKSGQRFISWPEGGQGNSEEEPNLVKSRKVEPQTSSLIDLCDCEVKQDVVKTDAEEVLITCPVCKAALRQDRGLEHLNKHQLEVGEALARMQNFGAKLVVMKLVLEMQGLD
jgi:uncharacterized C2H2 Zn-finger protein